MDSFETIDVQREGRLAWITLNRPEKLNALNEQLLGELDAALERERTSDSRVLVLRGAGRAFSAGYDISSGSEEMSGSGDSVSDRDRQAGYIEHYLRLWDHPKPVVAAVNGHAHGLGLSLALACDIVYAAESAVFSLVFARVGIIPDGAAIFFLPRLVGLNRAKELVFSARRFGATEALDLGLVNHVVADDELLAAAQEFARTLATGPTAALGWPKGCWISRRPSPWRKPWSLKRSARPWRCPARTTPKASKPFKRSETPPLRGARPISGSKGVE